jgi:outer membrane protein
VGRHGRLACAGKSWRLSGGAAVVVVCLAAVVLGRPARAETLEQALANAYLINPVLNAERARLRAVDEQVAVAKSGLRPFISATGDYAYQNTDNDVSRPPGTTAAGSAFGIASAGGFPTGTSHPRGWAIQLTQPLFEGFQNLVRSSRRCSSMLPPPM